MAVTRLIPVTCADESETYGTVIGIDMGTTDPCVGVYHGGRVEITANDQGNRRIGDPPDAQRQAIGDADPIASLTVLRIVHEPAAAAITYGLDKEGGEPQIMAYDPRHSLRHTPSRSPPLQLPINSIFTSTLRQIGRDQAGRTMSPGGGHD